MILHCTDIVMSMSRIKIIFKDIKRFNLLLNKKLILSHNKLGILRYSLVYKRKIRNPLFL